MNLKYIKHIIDGVGFDKLKMCIDEVHEKSGKNKADTTIILSLNFRTCRQKSAKTL